MSDSAQPSTRDVSPVPLHGDPNVTPWWHPYWIDRTTIRRGLERHQQLFQGLVLDIGCRSRPYEELVERAGGRYIGLDLPRAKSARGHADVWGSGTRLPFRDKWFDAVLNTQVIDDIPDPGKLLREARRVLKPGGHLVLTVSKSWALHDEPHDYWRFTSHGLRYLLNDAGFINVEIEPRCGTWAMLAQLVSAQLDRTVVEQMRWLRGISFFGAAVQRAGLVLDRINYDDRDTLGYTAVAQAPDA
jgi:SAM-dependent methyltransferase